MINYVFAPLALEYDATAVRRDLNILGKRTQRRAQLGMRNSPPGEPYTRYSPRRRGFASRPGEYPRIDTGRLVGSLSWVATESQLRFGARAGVVDYAKDLDPSRPFIERSLRREIGESQDILNDYIVARRV